MSRTLSLHAYQNSSTLQISSEIKVQWVAFFQKILDTPLPLTPMTFIYTWSIGSYHSKIRVQNKLIWYILRFKEHF